MIIVFGGVRVKVWHKKFLSATEQNVLHQEFTEECWPAIYMNKSVFSKYMQKKGLAAEKMVDTFR